MSDIRPRKVILFANTDWYLYNFRLSLAAALRSDGYNVLLLSPSGAYGPRLLEAGYRWQAFPLSRKGVNPFYEVWTIFRLARLFRQEKPDVLHFFTIKPVIYGTLAARLAGVKKVIGAVTGLGYIFTDRQVMARLLRVVALVLYRFALRDAQVIFQTREDRQVFLQARLVKISQTHIIPGSGVDLLQFPMREEVQGQPLVILPSRMLWNKGVGEFVEAARRLKQEGVSARFALVGGTDPGNPTAVPETQLEEWQREGVVEWWGWQMDMPSVMEKAHVVCLPSYREGISKALLEAAATGRAIVTGDISGCRDVVRQGVNGLLVPIRDSKALAEAVKILLRDPDLRRQMGKKGREVVVASFSQERVISATLDIYRELEHGKARIEVASQAGTGNG